jgi:WhiB family redox-sensing transcriptional regulator
MANQRHGQHQRLRDDIDLAGGHVPCQDSPEIFFPEDFPDKTTRDYVVTLARAFCDSCPIKKECFTYAIEAGERYGIWAGSLPSER